MNVQGKIISATPGRSGVNQNTGKKWQKFDVVIVHTMQPKGEMFGTFDEQYLRLVGQEGNFEYTENQFGKTLDRLPRQQQSDRVMEELGKLSRKLDEVLELVSIRTPVKEAVCGNEDSKIPY